MPVRVMGDEDFCFVPPTHGRAIWQFMRRVMPVEFGLCEESSLLIVLIMDEVASGTLVPQNQNTVH
eukprot:477632-Rhodomonas_salina.3